MSASIWGTGHNRRTKIAAMSSAALRIGAVLRIENAGATDASAAVRGEVPHCTHYAPYLDRILYYGEDGPQFGRELTKRRTSMAEKMKKAKTPAKPRTNVASAGMIAAKKATVAKPMIAKTPTHEEIARLAHRYFVERGGKNGADRQDWLRAERELKGA